MASSDDVNVSRQKTSMPRIFAYPFVSLMGFGVALLLWVLIWSIAFDGKAGDFKSNAAVIAFIVWWSWAGISVYSRYIKKPREEKKRQRAEAITRLEQTIVPGSSLPVMVKTLRGGLPLIGEPRYRSSPDPSFDTIVEIETDAFIVSLFGSNEIVKSWSVR